MGCQALIILKIQIGLINLVSLALKVLKDNWIYKNEIYYAFT